MYLLFKSISKIYQRLLIKIPKILSTILYIPLLYLLGWLLAKPILLIDREIENISLIGTIFTFILFIFSLPKWFEIRWGINNSWSLLGINNFNRQKKIISYFIKGLIYSILLFSLILIPMIKYEWCKWVGIVSSEILLNSILLLIGVGFAEELIFRGWLLEELKNQFGFKKALISQALVFSFAHIGFDMPFWEMLSILSGLFFLGILLSIRRLKDDNSLWGCIGLHGGLVGIWFLLNNGLIEISKDAPMWLVGPGNINTNPLGGLYGIFLLIFLCIIGFFQFKNKVYILRKKKLM